MANSIAYSTFAIVPHNLAAVNGRFAVVLRSFRSRFAVPLAARIDKGDGHPVYFQLRFYKLPGPPQST
jgi:hypothetical protein